MSVGNFKHNNGVLFLHTLSLNMRYKIFTLIGALLLSVSLAQAQCDHDWDIDVTLTELQILDFEQTLSGELTAISFDVAFTDIDGGSWPSDLLVHVYAPMKMCGLGWV